MRKSHWIRLLSFELSENGLVETFIVVLMPAARKFLLVDRLLDRLIRTWLTEHVVRRRPLRRQIWLELIAESVRTADARSILVEAISEYLLRSSF